MPEQQPERLKGTCPVCCQGFVLRLDGTIRNHQSPFLIDVNRWPKLCLGTGAMPVESKR